MNIASIASAFPNQYYSQQELLDELTRQWGGQGVAQRLSRFHSSVAVRGRHLAMPMEKYSELTDFTSRNRAYAELATELSERALAEALEQADLPPSGLDHLFLVSVTGMATPSIDARLVNRLGLNRHIKRTPIFGLGCVAGAAGLARVSDYLAGHPRQSAALVAVELCSLTWQAGDVSVPNLIGSSLFGDGAAAVVMHGSERSAPGPKIVATQSVFYPETEQVMGWDIGSDGLKIQLSAGVPALVKEHLGRDIDAFLASQGLSRGEIGSWVLHTGGPKVLEAFEETLDLPEGALELTWESLAEKGNLSSVSVLLVLQQTWKRRPLPTGTPGLLLAMGPGFCSELVLFRW